MNARLVAAFALMAAPAMALPSADVASSADPPAGADPMPATADDVLGVLDRLQADDKKAADRLAVLAADAARVRALLLLRGRSYVKMARVGLLPVGGGLDALVDYAARLERLRRALAGDLERERSIAEERVRLGRERASFAERRDGLGAEQKALARSRVAILAAEERETAFRKAFLGNSAPAHTAVYGPGLGPSDPGDVSGGFAAQRGRLPFPIEGRVEIRPARLPSGDGPGLEMVAPAGSAVRAVYPGRVAFADSYADYGLTVIVDHGGGYYTVSGYLAGVDVKVGDEVGTNDRIGRVGQGPKGPALYFELRHASETLRPGSWFGI